MSKKVSIITAISFCIVLFGLAIAFLIVPDNQFSEQENRYLQTVPEFTWKSFFSGKFGSEMNDYYADQFPFRNIFVGAKGITETVLEKRENNGVLLGHDGQLATYRFTAYDSMTHSVQDTDGYFDSTVERGVNAVSELSKALADKGITTTVAIAPRTIDVAASAFDYPDDSSVALRELVNNGLAGVDSVDVIKMLREKYDDGEYVAYKTDHHWTTLGAYYVYEDLAESLEIQPITKDKYTVLSTDGFYGTTWSKAGLKYVGADTLEVWTYGNEDEFTVTDVDSGESMTGFYNYEYLAEKDKYATFLDGTHNKLVIKKNTDEPREVLLVAKDSFANSVIPFLAQHYDIVVLNLSASGDETNISKYAEEYGCDKVLIIFGLENVIGNARMSKIK